MGAGARGGRVPAVRARGGGAGVGADRGGRALRRGRPLRWRPVLRLGPGGARPAARPARRLQRRLGPRLHRDREPGRRADCVLVRGQPGRRPARRAPLRRPEPGRLHVGRRLGQRGRPVRRAGRGGLRRRGPRPVLAAPLRRRLLPAVGVQRPARHRGHGRAHVLVADPPRPRRLREPVRRARGDRRAPGAAPRRGRPLRGDAADAGAGRGGRPVLRRQRALAARRARRPRRDHVRAHARGDRQPGLRAGRGGPRRRRPEPVRGVLRRAPAVLYRGDRRVHVRRHARAPGRGPPAVLLQPPDRWAAVVVQGALRERRRLVDRQPRGDDDRRGRQARRPGRRVDARPPRRRDDGRGRPVLHARRRARVAARRPVRQLPRRARPAAVAGRADRRRRVRVVGRPRHARGGVPALTREHGDGGRGGRRGGDGRTGRGPSRASSPGAP